MIIHISIRLLLFIPFCQLLEHQNNKETGPRLSSQVDNGTAFVYNLPQDIFFEGESYRTLWVYANGYVTFGYPLEESGYPVSSDSKRIYDSLEDLQGPNAISVFGLDNERTTKSDVEARILVPHSPTGVTDDTVTKHGESLQFINGLNATDPVSHILEVAWTKMQPFGTEDDKENSFRLFLISTNMTTFCIIEYTDIQVSGYSRSGRRVTHQSGVYSKRQNRYFRAPQSTGYRDNAVNKSGITDKLTSWAVSLEDIPNSMSLRSAPVVVERNRFGPLPRKKQDVKVENISMFKTTGNDRQYPGDSIVVQGTEAKLESNISESTFRNSSTISIKGREGTTISGDPQMSEAVLNSPDLRNETRCMTEPCGDNEQDSYKSRNDWIPFFTTSKSPDMGHSSSHVTYTRHRLSLRSSTVRPGIRKQFTVSESSDAKTKPSHGNSLQGQTECLSQACTEQEECLRSTNGSLCCQCQFGSVRRLGQCVKRNRNFVIYSKRTVHVASTEKENWTFDLSLVFATRTLLNESFPRAYLTLVSPRVLSSDLRNFLFLLYPLFHIPISFYASSWLTQSVPNLDSIVMDRARIGITISIEHQSVVTLTFQLDRGTGADRWVTFVQGLSLKKLREMRLDNVKFDEKSSPSPYNLVYILRNDSFIEFPEQSVVFQDEERNYRDINVTWRGNLVFGASCLSSHLGSQTYFVKFSDRRYCNSDCGGGHRDKETNCRLMCLGSPFVFGTLPDPCQGNFCGANKICLNRGKDYECVCSHGLREVQDKCVTDSRSTTAAPTVIKERVSLTPRCGWCSEHANCQTVMNIECCTCKDGYVGSGRRCFDQNVQFELSGFGSLKVTTERTLQVLERKMRLRIRHLGSYTHEVTLQPSYLEIGKIPYGHDQERRLLHWLLLMSPLFELPLAVFARDNHPNHMGNLYSLSKGSLSLNITVESNLLPDIEITLAMREDEQSLDIFLSLTGVPHEPDTISLPDTTRFFNQRRLSNVHYTIKGSKLVFHRHRIAIPTETKLLQMWWKGTGDLHHCSSQTPQKTFTITMRPSKTSCNARCEGRVCIPYCQALPELQEIESLQCHEGCHLFATCINGVCVCRPGFSGNGIQCLAIRKSLECFTSLDCIGQPHTECRAKQCVCRPGLHMMNGDCVLSDKCPECLTTETCDQGKCVCKTGLLRNRVSGQCVFDCSVCDPVSTECRDDGCTCRLGFKPSLASHSSCSWPCSSDMDCPTHETCLPTKVCHCPLTRENGICQESDGCHGCHQQAMCHENRCKCRDDWLGNGMSCVFNCSLCFDSRLCSVDGGCSCPSGFKGDGKQCSPITCQPPCPPRSTCHRDKRQLSCVCDRGLIMEANECVSDSVKLSLLPPDQAVETVEGRSLTLICLATSFRSQLSLTWSRKSGKAIRSISQFVDQSRKALKLRLDSVGQEDSDLYTCSARTGHQISVNVSIGVRPCQDACGPFSVCVGGQCRCLEGLISDGIRCYAAVVCRGKCSANEMCNNTSGLCVCLPGLVRAGTRCAQDCRSSFTCHERAQCNRLSGLCECLSPFVGNGTVCLKKDRDSNCLLTKRCSSNATCQLVAHLNQYFCTCDRGFVGDGHLVCHPKLDCSSHKCQSGALCQPFIVKDAMGDSHQTGRCLCKPGHVRHNGSCTKHSDSQLTFWLAMGEAIIGYSPAARGRARFRYIDNERNTATANVITSLASDCEAGRLVWSGHNGRDIKSSLMSRFTHTILHQSNLGKVTGLVMDDETGNVFFSDSSNGRIGVVNIERNVTGTLIDLKNYSPGPLVFHRRSQRLFWIVNDYRNPRIETSLLTGERRSVFLSLNSFAVSVTVADMSHSTGSSSEDRLCWVEKHHPLSPVHSRVKAVLKCVTIRDRHSSSSIEVVHEILDHEPYTTLVYSNNRFYWNVRKRNFIKVWDTRKESEFSITPKCCEAGIRVFIVMSGQCRNPNTRNPCWKRSPRVKCSQLCVTKPTSGNELEAVCLAANSSRTPIIRHGLK